MNRRTFAKVGGAGLLGLFGLGAASSAGLIDGPEDDDSSDDGGSSGGSDDDEDTEPIVLEDHWFEYGMAGPVFNARIRNETGDDDISVNVKIEVFDGNVREAETIAHFRGLDDGIVEEGSGSLREMRADPEFEEVDRYEVTVERQSIYNEYEQTYEHDADDVEYDGGDGR